MRRIFYNRYNNREKCMVFDDKVFIGRKIKLARKKAKLTQEELAEKIGITAKQLSRIEIAKYMPSVPTFLKLVKELNIDLVEFGINQNQNINRIRSDFLKTIYSLTDSELEFCYNVLLSTKESFKLLK